MAELIWTTEIRLCSAATEVTKWAPIELGSDGEEKVTDPAFMPEILTNPNWPEGKPWV